MSLEWQEPSDNGGCPILSYYLLRDDGITGVPTIEVNSVNDITVRNIPTLRNVDVILDPATLGRSYTFQLFVVNNEGTTSSQLVSYLFASIPQTPSSAPVI